MVDTTRPKCGFPWPGRYWLIGLGGGLLIVLLWVGAVADIARFRRLTLEYNERELSSLARALAEQTARSLQGIEFILVRTSTWALDPRRTQTSPADSDAFLREEINGVPQIHHLEIFDAAGNRTATTLLTTKPLSVADRTYFQQLQRASGNALAISEPFKSLSEGRPMFVVARRLEDAQGQFKGAIVAGIEYEYFRKFYEQVGLGPGTAIRLLRTDGTPVVVFEDRLPADRTQTQTRYVHRPVPHFPLAIEVSREEAVALAMWRTLTIDELIGAAVLSLFIMVLAVALVRQLRNLRRVNSQLRSSQQRWRAVFDNAPVGIMLLRPRDHYMAVNPSFQRMVGYSTAELEQMMPADITHPDDIQLTQRHIDQLVCGEHDSVRFEKRYLHRDGRVVWTVMNIARVTVSVEPSHRAAPHLTDLLVSTVEDVTQRRDDEQARRLLESQLRQSQKLEALGTFAGGIAHDFNNILGAILGYGERALHAVAKGSPEQRYVEQMLKAGDRARSLVERILTFSRSGLTTRLPVHVEQVITETIDLMRIRLPDTIRLDVQLDAPYAFIAGDPAHLHQVVTNLCSNAVHAMPHGGTIRLELALHRLEAPRSFSHGALGPGDFVRLSVRDSGVGISPELLERIFNPFFTTRKAGEGTGLGLALVEGIVREYSGAVNVRSAPGEGASFDVYLPVIDAVEADVDPLRAALPLGNGQSVLLVDDEEALVGLGEEVLAELRYEPIGFTSSEAAWLAFHANPQRFDVVVTDQTMPNMTGIELALRIHAIRPDIPILLVSGNNSAVLEREAKAIHISAVLRKPVRQADIARALSRVLAREDDETAT
ncbi:PAS domain S-box-containing protein [Paraburkholderia sp. BL6669N2]|uniref:ATP-binding protein n=1 Tax=Paraburkholderia sp. BL6669N2 TaxID=1938807 RepID=UPI000E260F97|nr:ATP-binding protein [Paraburkholderia sp. BL6669N2]REG52176.1 PAS domain S-box-containing protein [Paraburkholderia sp. BL6669N2]